MGKTLGKIKTKKDQHRTQEVDITRFLEDPEERLVLLFKEPDAPIIFLAGELAKKILTNNAGWPESLCKCVALLAASHVLPAEDAELSAPLFYTDLAANSKAAFFYVLNSHSNAFPEVDGFQEAIEETKNAYGATVEAGQSSTTA